MDACRYMAALLVGALDGASRDELLSPLWSPDPDLWAPEPLGPRIDDVAGGSFLRKEPPEIRGTGYVVDSLKAALWAFSRSSSFADGCLLAANLGDDADTTAAVYGQIAGAFYGADRIPGVWLAQLYMRETIQAMALRLVEVGDG